jgi:hypothetical protein
MPLAAAAAATGIAKLPSRHKAKEYTRVQRLEAARGFTEHPQGAWPTQAATSLAADRGIACGRLDQSQFGMPDVTEPDVRTGATSRSTQIAVALKAKAAATCGSAGTASIAAAEAETERQATRRRSRR